MPIVIGSCCLGIVFTSLGLIGYFRHEDKPGLVRSTHKYLSKPSFLSGKESGHELEPSNVPGATCVGTIVGNPHPQFDVGSRLNLRDLTKLS
jgi:hypothetical protein